MKLSSKDRMLLLVLMLAICALGMPGVAEAQNALFNSGTNFLQSIVDLLTNVWSRLIAIIAVVFLGFMAMFQRITWTHVGFVGIGLVLVFGAAAVVDSVQGSV